MTWAPAPAAQCGSIIALATAPATAAAHLTGRVDSDQSGSHSAVVGEANTAVGGRQRGQRVVAAGGGKLEAGRRGGDLLDPLPSDHTVLVDVATEHPAQPRLTGQPRRQLGAVGYTHSV